ncbi:MAG: hypothetical protein PHR61_03300 [Candidatus Absconditabacteria bacterium]|nr:hypothetical protein [Candidatus Absconditabacteria bacterium]
MKIRKKLLGYLAVIGLGFTTFAPSTMMGNIVHAQDTTTQQTSIEEGRKEFWDFIDLGLKLIYVVLRPMLFLAGIAMDNSMVYGSIFNMDAPLWAFWNMTKNFANFTLGFIVLFSILKGIFSSFGKDKGKDARSPITVIKNTLIAGVLIQASWFLTAALIDVSTVATYSIGGMPTALLKNTEDTKKPLPKILPTHSQLDLDNMSTIGEKDLMVRYKIPLSGEFEGQTINVSPCLIRQLGTSSYIVGRQYGGTTVDFNHTNKKYITGKENPSRNICVFGNKIYFFNEFPNVLLSGENNYGTSLMNNINLLGSGVAKEVANCGFFIDLRQEKSSTGVCSQEKIKNGLTEENFTKIFLTTPINADNAIGVGGDSKDSRINQTAAPTVAYIIEESKGFMGPLATIYVSIMDFANLGDTSPQNSSLGKNLGDLLIRLGVALGMAFPLIALAVVLFIRIGFLWVVIAASPLIILANVFKDTLKIDKILENFSIENILKAAFAPVITVFALSISVIFMTTLSSSVSTTNMDKIDVISKFGGKYEEGPDKGFNYITFFGYTVAYPKQVSTYAGATGDWFSWMIVSFCGIGIMRFILFAAIKASGTIGKVGESIKNFGENVIKTAPIVPMAGGVGIGTLKEQLIDGDFATKYRENKVVDLPKQQENMNAYLEERLPSIKEDFGKDRTFSDSEKTMVESAINTKDSDKIISVLEGRGFIDKDAKDKTAELKKLYEGSSEFKDIIGGVDNNLQKKLFGDAEFILKQKQAEEKKLIESLKEEISDKYETETKLNEAIGKIEEDELKTIENGKTIKEVEAEGKKFKITKGDDGKLKTEEII